MKKLLNLLLAAAILVFPLSIGASAQENHPTSSDNYLTIAQYNKAYTRAANENSDGMLSLSDYNDTYGNPAEQYLVPPEATINTERSSFSEVKRQTKDIVGSSGEVLGRITLEYQTEIAGGRPQFVYSLCFLSHPDLDTYWFLDESHVDFTGDKLTVYFTFSFGLFIEGAKTEFFPS